jgi:hypothetical protein
MLQPGECVQLTNMLPGNPPIPRNGCEGAIVVLNDENDYFIPPSISFGFRGDQNIYAVGWVYNTTTGNYDLCVWIIDGSGVVNSLGTAVVTTPQFGMLSLFSSIYCFIDKLLTTWKGSGAAIGNKVIETYSTVRDMCITKIAEATLSEVDHDVVIFTQGKYLNYAFQYVRKDDAASWDEYGQTPEGMILPPAIVGAPKRVDTFLPGSCIGAENTTDRKSIVVTGSFGTVLDANWISTGGPDGSVNGFNATYLVDGDTLTPGANLDSPRFSGILFDFGVNNLKRISSLGLYLDSSGNTTGLLCGWRDSVPSQGERWNPDTIQCQIVPTSAGLNQYFLNNIPTTGKQYFIICFYPYELNPHPPQKITEIYMGEVGGTGTIGITINPSNDAILQGATHIRVSRSREQTTQALAEGAKKFFVADLPIGTATVLFKDTKSDAALSGELNQLITGYSEPPPAVYNKYVKGRLFLMDNNGKVYYSEVPGGDGGTSLDLAETYPQAWASLYKPLTYFIDCDSADGGIATGMETLGNDLYFIKENKIFVLYGSDPTATPLTRLSVQDGCSLPQTIIKFRHLVYGDCIFFLGNNGPAFILSGGQIVTPAEFKIKELWPEKSRELFDDIVDHYDYIRNNCTAFYYQDAIWIIYKTYSEINRIFGYYINPNNTNFKGCFETVLAFEAEIELIMTMIVKNEINGKAYLLGHSTMGLLIAEFLKKGLWEDIWGYLANFVGYITGTTDAPRNLPPETNVSFFNLSTIWADTFDWDFGDETAHSTDINPIHQYDSIGSYTVILIASNTHSNTVTKVSYVTVVDSTPDFSWYGDAEPPYDLVEYGRVWSDSPVQISNESTGYPQSYLWSAEKIDPDSPDWVVDSTEKDPLLTGPQGYSGPYNLTLSVTYKGSKVIEKTREIYWQQPV